MKLDLLRSDVKRSFFIMLASAIGSSIVATIYSTVDMICVGQYCGDLGAAALACINPMWSLMMSIGILTGVGGSVMMANRKGSGNERAGNEYFTLSLIISAVWCVLLVGTMTFFGDELLIFFGAKESEVLSLAKDYMKSIIFVAPTFTLCACLSTFMRSDGEALIPTVATVVGGVINMILDVVLVFDFGAGLGIFGAGLATSIGQAVAFLIIISYFFTKKCKLRLRTVSRTLTKLYRIVTIGFSAFLIEVSFGVTGTVFNNIITDNLSPVHLAVYGTASSVVIMLYCLFGGVGTAMQPLAAANFGAGNRERVTRATRLAMITATVMGCIFFALTQLFPGEIIGIYVDTSDSPEVLTVGRDIVRIYSAALPVVGVSVVATYYFQSVLRQSYSVVISLLRGLFCPLLFVITLPLITGDYNVIWWSMPLAEAATFIFAIIALIACKRRDKRKELREKDN